MQEPWWRGATIYQIYPRSFFDSNGDGVGDLPGITARLPYVAALGVDGIWLSPFFTSPMRDFGYDVANPFEVDPLFGTLADFDTLLATAHGLGLKVIIDQVWSHTAAQSAWFQASRSSRSNPHADWYVWADAKPDGSPPNNWQSWMGGPAWRWEPRRRQYHLHNFLPEMPDLNFHCPAVQDAVLDLARFWLDRGVDGFRLDTANLYFHDRLLRDNPPLPEHQRGDSPVLMQRHLHNADQPEALAFFERVRELLDSYGQRMAVAEVGGSDPTATMVAYTQGERRLHTAYSFVLLGAPPGPQAIAAAVATWQQGAAAEGWPSWALSNHDAQRAVSRWAAPPVTLLALLLALRGTVFLYQGEELGLPQSTLAYADLQDPFGKAHWPDHPGRDGCRTPMPWQADAPHAGFSTHTPWLPADPAHRALAVDRQLADPHSTWHAARRLIALRREHAALRLGRFELLHADDSLLLLQRVHGPQTLHLAFNLGSSTRQAPTPGHPLRTLFATDGAQLLDNQFHLPPGGVIFAAPERLPSP